MALCGYYFRNLGSAACRVILLAASSRVFCIGRFALPSRSGCTTKWLPVKSYYHRAFHYFRRLLAQTRQEAWSVRTGASKHGAPNVVSTSGGTFRRKKCPKRTDHRFTFSPTPYKAFSLFIRIITYVGVRYPQASKRAVPV